MYHLYGKEEVNRAIDEAVRVTKPGRVILFAFLSVYAIMYANAFYGHWMAIRNENYTDDFQVKHEIAQLFTGYDIEELEQLFQDRPVDWLTTTGVDGPLEVLEKRSDFALSEEEFEDSVRWYLTFCEKRELLGSASHLLHICRKRF